MASPFPKAPRVAQPASRTLALTVATARGLHRIPAGTTKIVPLGLLSRDVGVVARDPAAALRPSQGEDVSHHVAAGRFLAGTWGGGAYESADGTDWTELPIDARDVWCFAFGPDGRTYAGVEPAAVYRLDEAGAWTSLSALQTAPGAEEWSSPWGAADVSTILPHPDDPDKLWVGIEVGGCYGTEDGGASWLGLNEGLHPDVHTLAHHPTRPERLWAATADGVHRSDDGGQSWEKKSAGITRGYTSPLVVAPDDPNLLYTAAARGPSGTDTRVYRSRNAGDRWEEVANGLPKGVKGVERHALVAVPGNPWLLLLGTGGGEVYVSDDRGDSWRLAVQNLPAVRGIVTGPG